MSTGDFFDEALALVNRRPRRGGPPPPPEPDSRDDDLSLWRAVSGGATNSGTTGGTTRGTNSGTTRGTNSGTTRGTNNGTRPATRDRGTGTGARPTSRSPEPAPAPDRPAHRPEHPRGLAWREARRVARGAGERLGTVRLPLAEALGQALALPLPALTDLPAFDTSAMDGWAVAGPGPWALSGRLLAGERRTEPLLDGEAVTIATGAALPPGATAVLRREHGRADDARTPPHKTLLHSTVGAPEPGQDVRPRAQECRAGDELLAAGALVTPAVLGLAAAAGYDELTVVRRPRVEVLVLGDELLDSGLPTGGRVRDALGPLLPPWLRALGAEVTAVRRLVDDEDTLYEAVRGGEADVVVTSGGTAGGPVDFVHPVLARLGATTLVDGVAVRPGHPMLLARLPGGRHLVGLPGNPLAAVSGVLTLAEPLLRTLGGRPPSVPYAAELTAEVAAHPADTRLVPVVFDDESRAEPLHFNGPAMLRGLAVADGMAVIPPGAALGAGSECVVLRTAWGTAWGTASGSAG